VIVGDQLLLTNSSGSTIYTRQSWGWANTTALQVHGDAIISGTLAANKITTGTLSADRVSGGTLTGADINITTGGATVLSVIASAGVVRCSKLFSGPLLATNSADPGFDAVAGLSYGSGLGVLGTVSSSNTSTTAHGVRGQNQRYGSSGLVGPASGYDFYADGTGVNYGPFTGAHDALLPSGDPSEIGDILVDTALCIKGNISNVITEVQRSTIPNQKAAVGVLAFNNGPLRDAYTPISLYLESSSFYSLQDTHDYIAINSLGEGQINVCGEGGDLEIGDLIVTSSMPGKGMRQADDIVRSYTVAKCRENVTFTSPTEVKMVACIYLCG